jgi:CMP-N,N'-diacetyllegionaminic acid synthase
MIKGKKVLAVIPARGGSNRLPRKNVLPLQGKPLIAWTILAGLNSKYIDRVVVSTDSDEIAGVSRKYGADVPFMRPQALSDDTATTDSVILHILDELSSQDLYDIIIVLQPTSPLRTVMDIDNSLEMLQMKQADGVVSVCECEHSPFWSNTIPENGNMGAFIKDDIKGKRSQDLPSCYRLNGAIYVFTTSSIILNKGIRYTRNVFSMVMPALRSVDIDHELDFRLAEVILGQ